MTGIRLQIEAKALVQGKSKPGVFGMGVVWIEGLPMAKPLQLVHKNIIDSVKYILSWYCTGFIEPMYN